MVVVVARVVVVVVVTQTLSGFVKEDQSKRGRSVARLAKRKAAHSRFRLQSCHYKRITLRAKLMT